MSFSAAWMRFFKASLRVNRFLNQNDKPLRIKIDIGQRREDRLTGEMIEVCISQA